MLEVKGVTKRYRKTVVLNNICFSAETASSVCIVGQNGSGKSTLLSIIAGHLRPDSGDILYNGTSLFSETHKRLIGYVPQTDNLFPALSVRDNIAFWASAAGLSFKKVNQQGLPSLLGIETFWNKKVSALSGGMRRRVAICAALLHNPALLLLDEPFTGLDLVVKEDLLQSLEALRAAGHTIIYTTHNLDEVARLPGKMIALNNTTATEVPPWNGQGDFREFMLNTLKGERI